MSNRWYKPLNKQVLRYVGMQVVTIISGMAGFHVGSTFHIGPLLGVGGTFFCLYLLEKYYEIPWKGVGDFWSLLGVAVALYFSSALLDPIPNTSSGACFD